MQKTLLYFFGTFNPEVTPCQDLNLYIESLGYVYKWRIGDRYVQRKILFEFRLKNEAAILSVFVLSVFGFWKIFDRIAKEKSSNCGKNTD